jgi:3-methyladenine DNA glycosylase AlkD
VSVPVGRRIVRAAVKDVEARHGALEATALREVASELWDAGPFELRRAAVELLMFRSAALGPEQLDFLAALVIDGETWAIVDPLATDVVGAIALRGMVPRMAGSLDAWSEDPAMWLRRASLLALLPSLRRDDRDWARFGRYADAMLDEREFFIRKAIGWVLREVSKRRPDDARAWVEPRLGRMSGVTRREALKYLPPEVGT